MFIRNPTVNLSYSGRAMDVYFLDISLPRLSSGPFSAFRLCGDESFWQKMIFPFLHQNQEKY